MYNTLTTFKFLFLFTLTIIISQSCGDDDDVLVVPQVSASFTQTIDQETGTVSFDNTSQNADSFSWDFGDGTSSTEADPTKVYEESGTFTAVLTASNSAGQSDTAQETIVITLPEEEMDTPFESGLLANGDFETTDAVDNVTAWIIGVDDSAPAPTVVENGNRLYQATVTSPDPNQPFLVNVSQRVEIVSGTSYRLQFDAWSDVDRSIIAGIGLSGGDFNSAIEFVDITSTPTTYEIVLCANNFGAADARVLFDLNAEAGTVSIDNVALFVEDDTADCSQADTGGATGELAVNGDFENVDANEMVTDWIEGVNPDLPAPTAVENGNRFYSRIVVTPDPNQPFLVNVSQFVEIIQGNTYILEFEAWSDVDRTIIAGIGLSGGDFNAAIETVSITPTPTVYTITLLADGFGAPNARILFDLNADAGMVGIDNVSLMIQ